MNDRCFCGFKKELNKSSCCVQCFIGKGHGPLCKKIVCNNTEDNNKITKVIHKTGPNTNNFDKFYSINLSITRGKYFE